MSEKRGFHKNVESGTFSRNVEGVASRTLFFTIYSVSQKSSPPKTFCDIFTCG